MKACRSDEAKLSQEQLGEELGYHGSYISKIEHGREPPKLTKSLALKIINVLRQYGASAESIDLLSEEANRLQGDFSNLPLADPFLIDLSQRLQGKPRDEVKLSARFHLALADVIEAIYEARRNVTDGKWKSAEDRVISRKRRWDRIVSREIELYVNEVLADSVYYQGRFEDAIRNYERVRLIAFSLKQQEKDVSIPPELKTRAQELEALSYIRIGNAYRRLAQWKAATEQFLRAKELSKDPSWICDCKRRIAAVQLFQSLADQAEVLCGEILQELPEADLPGRLKTLQHLGWANRYKGRWDEAIQNYKAAEEILEQTVSDDKLMVGRIKSWRYQADVYSLRREWRDEAERLYRRALDTLQDFKGKGSDELIMLRGMNLLGLGQVYIEQPEKEYDAQMYLDESEELHLRLRELLGIPLVYIAKGRLFTKIGLFSEAEGCLQSAKDRLMTVGNSYYLGEVLVSFCQLYYDKQEFPLIYQMAEEDMTPFEKDLFLIHRARIQLIKGKAYLRQGNYERAFQALCDATRTGLAYNRYIFEEVFDELSEQVDYLSSNRDLEHGAVFCQKYRDFWQARLIKPEDRPVVTQSLELIAQKEREFLALDMEPRVLIGKEVDRK
jgi:tetratricopeptide (TPR) repeat protein